jgi:hypothetical protein
VPVAREPARDLVAPRELSLVSHAREPHRDDDEDDVLDEP